MVVPLPPPLALHSERQPGVGTGLPSEAGGRSPPPGLASEPCWGWGWAGAVAGMPGGAGRDMTGRCPHLARPCRPAGAGLGGWLPAVPEGNHPDADPPAGTSPRWGGGRAGGTRPPTFSPRVGPSGLAGGRGAEGTQPGRGWAVGAAAPLGGGRYADQGHCGCGGGDLPVAGGGAASPAPTDDATTKRK